MTAEDRIKELEDEVRALCNRCDAMTMGKFCVFCKIKDCTVKHEDEEKLKSEEKPKKVRQRAWMR